MCGCSESYSVETNQEFRLIENDCNDIVPFVQEIEEIAKSKNRQLKLNVIKLYYDSDFNLEIDFTFSAEQDKNIGHNFIITYDASKKGVTKSEYVFGTKKVASVSSVELNYKRWNVSFEEGIEQIKNQLKQHSISDFDRINVFCYEKVWSYDVWLNDGFNKKEDCITLKIKTGGGSQRTGDGSLS